MAIEHPWGGALPSLFIEFGYFWVQVVKVLVFFNIKTHNVPVFFSPNEDEVWIRINALMLHRARVKINSLNRKLLYIQGLRQLLQAGANK